MATTIKRKARLALFGGSNSPKLYAALQIAYGLTGSYQRTIVIDATAKADRYSVLGDYHVCGIHPQATPDRYLSLLNIVQSTHHEVIILDLSHVWQGVNEQLNEFNYPEVLRSHRSLMQQIKYSCSHVIALVNTEKKLAYRDQKGNPKLHYEHRAVQQEGVENFFTTVLRIDRKGNASTVKDLTGTLPKESRFSPGALAGAALSDWCSKGKTVVPAELQRKINACANLTELYQLLFSEEVSDIEMISYFTQRRLELEAERDMEVVHEDYPF